MNAWDWRGPVADPADFGLLTRVLRREPTPRPVLFEFFFNSALMAHVLDDVAPRAPDAWNTGNCRLFGALGYEHATISVPGFGFPRARHAHGRSVSLNDQALIHDRASFERYPWPDPAAADWSALDRYAALLRPGMRLMVCAPDGLLENAVALIGFERLCLLLVDDPGLVADVFAAIGERLEAYYLRALRHPAVGLLMGNDDWGFRSGTMLSPRDLRRYVFPWHERWVAAAHAAGRPAVLHSCGRLDRVMDDIIDGLRYDARHSWEDAIEPVEDAYERWGGRIAILGGLDVDRMATGTPREIHDRAAALVRRSAPRGGYALGTGNSVPDWIPHANALAMVEAGVAGRARAPALARA